MPSDHDLSQRELLDLTTDIVSAYVSNNKVDSNKLTGLLRDVYKTLSNFDREIEKTADNQRPAVPIAESVADDYIICLEDGKKLKMLKRYLKASYDMTPEDYRLKWGLPADYPMVAPNYAKKRSRLAKEIGLGKDSPATKKE